MKWYGRKSVVAFSSILFFITATSLVLYAASGTEKKQDTALSNAPGITQDTPESHQNRIDFGNTYIIGQTIKSGAVYLLQRKKSDIKSMLRYREDYRSEILEGFSVDTSKVPHEGQKQDQLSKGERQGSLHLISQE
jgi:hypothetical protein